MVVLENKLDIKKSVGIESSERTTIKNENQKFI